MERHKTISLADQVFERLEGEILGGKYQPGEILTELRLTADLGVSRTPVREALRRLEQERIVELSSRGILVLGLTEKDIEDIYAIRLHIEGLAAAAAAAHKDAPEAAELLEALELQEYYVSREDADHIKGMDNRFHELVYRMSGSTVLHDTLLPLHKKVQKYRRVAVQKRERAVDSVREHREIYEAIIAGDSARAAAAATAHVKNAMAQIVEEKG